MIACSCTPLTRLRRAGKRDRPPQLTAPLVFFSSATPPPCRSHLPWPVILSLHLAAHGTQGSQTHWGCAEPVSTPLGCALTSDLTDAAGAREKKTPGSGTASPPIPLGGLGRSGGCGTVGGAVRVKKRRCVRFSSTCRTGVRPPYPPTTSPPTRPHPPLPKEARGAPHL